MFPEQLLLRQLLQEQLLVQLPLLQELDSVESHSNLFDKKMFCNVRHHRQEEAQVIQKEEVLTDTS